MWCSEAGVWQGVHRVHPPELCYSCVTTPAAIQRDGASTSCIFTLPSLWGGWHFNSAHKIAVTFLKHIKIIKIIFFSLPWCVFFIEQL